MNDGPILVIDNGSGYCKAGFVGDIRPRIEIPNAIAESRRQPPRQVIGWDNIQALRDSGGYILHRPLQAGLLTDVGAQASVWTHLLENLELRDRDLRDMSLTLLESYGTPPIIYNNLQEIIFEKLGFRSAIFLPAQTTVPWAFKHLPTNDDPRWTDSELGVCQCEIDPYGQETSRNKRHYERFIDKPTSLIKESRSDDLINPISTNVDLGFSGGWACSIFHDSTILEYATFRNFNGGYNADKILKKAICFRDVRLDYAELTIEDIRKKCCEVTMGGAEYVELMHRARQEKMRMARGQKSDSGIVALYDFQKNDLVVDATEESSQLLRVGCERFSTLESLIKADETGGVGEALLTTDESTAPLVRATNVSNGTKTGDSLPVARSQGIAELTLSSIVACPPILQRSASQNIRLAGGLWNTKGLVQRYLNELRSSLPQNYAIQVTKLSDNTQDTAWLAAAVWASENFAEHAVSREHYREDAQLSRSRPRLSKSEI